MAMSTIPHPLVRGAFPTPSRPAFAGQQPAGGLRSPLAACRLPSCAARLCPSQPGGCPLSKHPKRASLSAAGISHAAAPSHSPRRIAEVTSLSSSSSSFSPSMQPLLPPARAGRRGQRCRKPLRCQGLAGRNNLAAGADGGKEGWEAATATGVIQPHEGGLQEGSVPSHGEPQILKTFHMRDFAVSPHVSVGLCGHGDEVLYEAVVTNPTSHLRGTRVVLRSLTGPRALRWGQRALEVMPRLSRSDGWHHPYAARLHGYIPSAASAGGRGGGPHDNAALTLVHGYYGSYSLHHWLLRPDWLPMLEARLALDEEAARRVGDERTGGPTVTRQLRVIRMVLRDVLIGLNYVHSRGMAHLDMRLENVHVSAADRHVKVGILGKAVDFPSAEASAGAGPAGARQKMIDYDIRCVGLMMARMVIGELKSARTSALFTKFLKEGHNPAGLREFLRPLLIADDPRRSTSMQILDGDNGAGWHLLAAMLSPHASSRISCVKALRHPFLCGPRWRVHLDASGPIVRWCLGSAAVRIVEEYIYLPHQRHRLAQLTSLLEHMAPPLSLQDWLAKAPGKWRLLYHTGRQIGLTIRQASPAVRIGQLTQTFMLALQPGGDSTLQMAVDVPFTMMPESSDWPLDKRGVRGLLKSRCASVALTPGMRMHTEKLAGGIPGAAPGGSGQGSPHRGALTSSESGGSSAAGAQGERAPHKQWQTLERILNGPSADVGPVGGGGGGEGSPPGDVSAGDAGVHVAGSERPSAPAPEARNDSPATTGTGATEPSATNDVGPGQVARSGSASGEAASAADEPQEARGREQAEEGTSGGSGMEEALSVLGVRPEEAELGLELDYKGSNSLVAQSVLREVRIQIPREMFDVSTLACATYVDDRLMVLRGVSGAALLFARSPDVV